MSLKQAALNNKDTTRKSFNLKPDPSFHNMTKPDLAYQNICLHLNNKLYFVFALVLFWA
jgi:hypothetical protein